MKRAILGLTVATACLLIPGQAVAQTNGLFVGAAGSYAIVSMEDSNHDDSGIGATGMVGYGLGMIAPYVKVVYASITPGGDNNDADNYTLMQGDAGARVMFAMESLTPFVNGGFTYQRVSMDSGGGDYSVTGTGFTFGGGILYALGSMMLEAALNVTSGNFTDAEYNGQSTEVDFGNTTYRVDLGVTVPLGGDDM